MLGIDYAWSHPRPEAIAGAGYGFVMRYLSYDPSKNLTADEVTALQASGIRVGVVWESTASRALSGLVGGAQDGIRAKHLAEEAGAPNDAPIFFAVDFDARPNQLQLLDDYRWAFEGAIAPHPVGVYGGVATCEHFADVQHRWQTSAWSGGRLAAGICLYQRLGYVHVDGVECDENERLVDHFCGWPNLVPTQAPPAPVTVTDYPEDSVKCITVHVDHLDAQGHGYSDIDAPAGTVTGVRINTAGYAGPLPSSPGDEDNGGRARVQWVGPPNASGFDARIWVAQ